MLSARYQDSWGAEGTFDLLTDIQAISLPPLELHPMQANAPFALTKARLPAGAKTPMASHWAICHPTHAIEGTAGKSAHLLPNQSPKQGLSPAWTSLG